MKHNPDKKTQPPPIILPKEPTAKPVQTIPNNPFFAFLRQPEQKRNMLFLLVLYLVAFIFIAYTYPSPYTNADTGSYLACSVTGNIDGYRPIGYSWFLGAFRAISPTTFFAFFAQFWLNALANTFFLFTIQYFFRPMASYLFWAATVFTVLSPTILFLSNALLSDSIFNTLSIAWLASGIWLWRRFSIPMLLLHLLVLYLAVNVRYAGLFYPALSALILFFQIGSKRYYLPILPLLLGVYIYASTKAEMKQRFGTDTFSAFSGWAQANNATAVIPYTNLQPEDISNEQSRIIHQFVIAEATEKYNTQNVMGTMFIWGKERAGKQALFAHLKKNPGMDYTRAWVRMGTWMGNYATTLRQRYPMQYVQHFILPNLANVFIPRFDFLQYKNIETTDEAIQSLYGDKSFTARYDWIATYIATLCRPANIVLWLLTLTAIGILSLRRKQQHLTTEQYQIAAALALFISAYIGFSIVAHPFYLRYAIPLHAPQIALIWVAAIAYTSFNTPTIATRQS